MKVLTVFGTRPEAIKMAPVVKAMGRHPAGIESKVCVTAQHRGMLDQVLSLFDISPDYDLNVMRPGQSPLEVAVAVMAGLEPVVAEERPDWVLVQGDTTTVMAAAVTAFYARAKVGHLEAGLRTFSRHSPFPEEINRRLTSVAADLHFAPTLRARQNLLLEGVADERILVTGNTVIDALHEVASLDYDPSSGPLADVRFGRKIMLATSHRRENFGKPLENICEAIAYIADEHAEELEIVFSVHPNPEVQSMVHRRLGDHPNVRLLPPLDYMPFVFLLKSAYLVLTDSGGVQEEAPGLGKPVLVLREVTERPEAVESGTVRLVGTNRLRIVEAVERLLSDEREYARMARAVNPYGDGRAAERVVEAMLEARTSLPAVMEYAFLSPFSASIGRRELSVEPFQPTTAEGSALEPEAAMS
jgi:UDP-N-acetylglucosamine 2-epimerase (non-hydrolysing)